MEEKDKQTISKENMTPEQLARLEAIKIELRKKRLMELRAEHKFKVMAMEARIEREKEIRAKKARQRKIVLWGILGLFVAFCFLLYFINRFSSDAIDNQSGIVMKKYETENYFTPTGGKLTRLDGKVSNFRNYISKDHKEELEYVRENIKDAGNVTQAVFSPDHSQILFSTIVYNYDGSNPKDDEYCFYYVVDISSNNPILLFKGYREWYEIDWL